MEAWQETEEESTFTYVTQNYPTNIIENVKKLNIYFLV